MVQKGQKIDKKATKPATIDRELLMSQCVDLRRKGLPYKRIAEIVGISADYASKLVRRSLKQYLEGRLEAVQEILEGEWAITEQLIETFLPLALDGDTKASDQMRWILERRSKYLGLDAPVKTDTHVSGSLQAGTPVLTRDQMKQQILDRLAQVQRVEHHPPGGNGHDNGNDKSTERGADPSGTDIL